MDRTTGDRVLLNSFGSLSYGMNVTADDTYVWTTYSRASEKIWRFDSAGVLTEWTASTQIVGGELTSAGDYLYGTPNINEIGRWNKIDGSYTSVVGSSTAGYVDGVGSSVRFDGVNGLATSGNGIFYVFDTNNNVIRSLEQAWFFGDDSFAYGWDGYGAWNGGINAGVGNYVTSATDASIATAGGPLEMVRTYNSRDLYEGPLGVGWRFNLEMRWEAEADGNVAVLYPDGRRETHTDNGDGTYSPPEIGRASCRERV